jgi:RNA recognition motif-containing protein
LQIEQVIAKLGVKLSPINGIEENKKPGSATIDVASGADLDAAIKALQGADCGGRPMRVQRVEVKRVRRRSSTSRYFLGTDISIKCNACGLVGHKSADCRSPMAQQPCHLCAGRDHDACKPVDNNYDIILSMLMIFFLRCEFVSCTLFLSNLLTSPFSILILVFVHG